MDPPTTPPAFPGGEESEEESWAADAERTRRWVGWEDTLADTGGAGPWRWHSNGRRYELEDVKTLMAEWSAERRRGAIERTRDYDHYFIDALVNEAGAASVERIGYPGSILHRLYTTRMNDPSRLGHRAAQGQFYDASWLPHAWWPSIKSHLRILDLLRVELGIVRDIVPMFGGGPDSTEYTHRSLRGRTQRPPMPLLTHLRLEHCSFLERGGLQALYDAALLHSHLVVFSVTASRNARGGGMPSTPRQLFYHNEALASYATTYLASKTWPFQMLRAFRMGGVRMHEFPSMLLYAPMDTFRRPTGDAELEHNLGIELMRRRYKRHLILKDLPRPGPILDDDRWADEESLWPSTDPTTSPGGYGYASFPMMPDSGEEQQRVERQGFVDLYPRLTYISLPLATGGDGGASERANRIASGPALNKLASQVGLWMEKMRHKALEGDWNTYEDLEEVVDTPDFYETMLPVFGGRATTDTQSLLQGGVMRPWRFIHSGLNLRKALDNRAVAAHSRVRKALTAAAAMALGSHGRPRFTFMPASDLTAGAAFLTRMSTLVASGDDVDSIIRGMQQSSRIMGVGRSPHDGRGLAIFVPPSLSAFGQDVYRSVVSLRALDRPCRLSPWHRWRKGWQEGGGGGGPPMFLYRTKLPAVVSTATFDPIRLTHLDMDNLALHTGGVFRGPTGSTMVSQEEWGASLLPDVILKLRNLSFLSLRLRKTSTMATRTEIRQWLDYFVNPRYLLRAWAKTHRDLGFWPLQHLRYLRLMGMKLRRLPQALLPQPVTDHSGTRPMPREEEGDDTFYPMAYVLENYPNTRDRGHTQGNPIPEKLIHFHPAEREEREERRAEMPHGRLMFATPPPSPPSPSAPPRPRPRRRKTREERREQREAAKEKRRRASNQLWYELWPELNHIDLRQNNLLLTLETTPPAESGSGRGVVTKKMRLHRKIAEERMNWLMRWVARCATAARLGHPGVRWRSLGIGPTNDDGTETRPVRTAGADINVLANEYGKSGGDAMERMQDAQPQTFADWVNEAAFVWNSTESWGALSVPMLWSHSTLDLQNNPVDLRRWNIAELQTMAELRITMYASHITPAPDRVRDAVAPVSEWIENVGMSPDDAERQVAAMRRDRSAVRDTAVQFLLNNVYEFTGYGGDPTWRHLLTNMAGYGYQYDVSRAPQDMPQWRGRGMIMVHDDSDSFNRAVVALCAIDAGLPWSVPVRRQRRRGARLQTHYGMGSTPSNAYGSYDPRIAKARAKELADKRALRQTSGRRHGGRQPTARTPPRATTPGFRIFVDPDTPPGQVSPQSSLDLNRWNEETISLVSITTIRRRRRSPEEEEEEEEEEGPSVPTRRSPEDEEEEEGPSVPVVSYSPRTPVMARRPRRRRTRSARPRRTRARRLRGTGIAPTALFGAVTEPEEEEEEGGGPGDPLREALEVEQASPDRRWHSPWGRDYPPRPPAVIPMTEAQRERLARRLRRRPRSRRPPAAAEE